MTLNQTKEHKFFQDVNWDGIIEKAENKNGVIKTKVKEDFDILNINKKITNTDFMNFSVDTTDEKLSTNPIFVGFTYNEDG